MTGGLLADARLLARQGYVRANASTGAIVASVGNHGTLLETSGHTHAVALMDDLI